MVKDLEKENRTLDEENNRILACQKKEEEERRQRLQNLAGMANDEPGRPDVDDPGRPVVPGL
jgi:hypothetical protein